MFSAFDDVRTGIFAVMLRNHHVSRLNPPDAATSTRVDVLLPHREFLAGGLLAEKKGAPFGG